MRTQERWTIKTTFAGDRQPEYEHFPYREEDPVLTREQAMAAAQRRFGELKAAASFEVTLIQLYEEFHIYTIRPPIEEYSRHDR